MVRVAGLLGGVYSYWDDGSVDFYHTLTFFFFCNGQTANRLLCILSDQPPSPGIMGGAVLQGDMMVVGW